MLLKLTHELSTALSSHPVPLLAQQEHFAVTIPELRKKLLTALTDEFSRHELETLREELASYSADPLSPCTCGNDDGPDCNACGFVL